MDRLLTEILDECRIYTKDGSVASYIPELKNANPENLGICVIAEEDTFYCAGDYKIEFTMQSIAKPIILLLALMDKGEEEVRKLVGVEATGKPFDAFNYSDQALKRDHINPMINAGAIALCTLINGDTYKEKFSRLLNLIRKIAGNPHLTVDEDVYISEKSTGSKNRALAYMLKAYGMISDNIEDILDCYFRACSVKIDSFNLAKIAYVFANKGKSLTGEYIFDRNYSRYINAVLMTCGMYDGSGEFALNVGVPAKSGVGGGIMAIVPGRMGIGIYSPALDNRGNSCAGIKVLEKLSKELELSIF